VGQEFFFGFVAGGTMAPKPDEEIRAALAELDGLESGVC
jgi:hypothetical protein